MSVIPLTTGPDYIRFSTILHKHITCVILNKVKVKRDISQQYLKIIDLHFVKSE